MRLWAIAVCFVVALCGEGSSEEPRPLSPVEAIKQIGTPEVTVEMKVQAVKDRLQRRGAVYLDSEADFKDEKNLGIALSAAAARGFKARGIDDPVAYFLGKTIRVKGCVLRLEERPYIVVHSLDQIQVTDKK